MLRAMSSLTSFGRLGLSLFLVALLAACTTNTFKADVSRFAVPLPALQGQTFAVVADDPRLAGGIEFGMYANLVAKELEKLGYVRAASPEVSDLLVRFNYGVDSGRERVRTDFVGAGFAYGPWAPWGPWRGGFGYWGYGFYDPWLAGPDIRSYTVYTSSIDLKIDRRVDGQRLFEGRAEAVSRTNRLQWLVPNLVDALFTDFPGRSGETVRITIRDNKKAVREVK